MGFLEWRSCLLNWTRHLCAPKPRSGAEFLSGIGFFTSPCLLYLPIVELSNLESWIRAQFTVYVKALLLSAEGRGKWKLCNVNPQRDSCFDLTGFTSKLLTTWSRFEPLTFCLEWPYIVLPQPRHVSVLGMAGIGDQRRSAATSENFSSLLTCNLSLMYFCGICCQNLTFSLVRRWEFAGFIQPLLYLVRLLNCIWSGIYPWKVNNPGLPLMVTRLDDYQSFTGQIRCTLFHGITH